MARKKNQTSSLEAYSIEELEDMETRSSGHFHNLKMEEEISGTPTRWWLSRMTVEDGETSAVYVEQFTDGAWGDVHQYGDPRTAEERFGNPQDIKKLRSRLLR